MFVIRKTNRRGFTLLEVVLAMVLMAIALPTIANLYVLSMEEEAHTALEAKASFLASSLMDEISRRRFRESAGYPGCGSDSGEVSAYSRAGFDDIDDYDYFTDTWVALSPPRDESGTSMSDYDEFTQLVEVYNVSNPTSGPTARANYAAQTDGTTNFKVVHVQISWDSGDRSVDLYKVFSIFE